ncbi:MAG: DASS family sodium-coupled anion symporter [Tissierellaceae bacterium]|nr:DASS family sodium-coupled anion symporter [Tissierellaceae bacterium]
MEKTEKKKTNNISTRAKIGGIIAILLFFGIMLFPTPDGMTIEGKKSLAVFTFALIMWVSRPIPIYQTSIIAILILPLIGAVEDQEVAFGTLGYDIIWLMVAAFVLTSAINQTNLGKRLALTLVTKLGRTPKGTLWALLLTNFILAFFVPSTTARAALLVPIVTILLEVYKQTPGNSKFGKLMTLQGVQTNAYATSMVMTATSAQVLSIGFINQMTGSNLGYMEWILGSAPQAILTSIIVFLIGYKLYKVEDDLTGVTESNEILKKQLVDLGPISQAEKKAAAIFIFTLLSWATENYQEAWFGFEFSTEQTAVISMLLCLLPGIGVLDWKKANIKWDLMIFSAGAYAVGNAFNDSGGASFIIGNMVDAMGLETMNHNLVSIILIFTTVFSHLIFTSKTVRATILIPTIVTLAQTLGMDPVPIAMACSFGIAYTITLPPHSKVNTLYFGSGYFDVNDLLKLGLLGCLVGSITISAMYFTWLQILY